MTIQRSTSNAHQPHIAKDLLFLIEFEKNIIDLFGEETAIKFLHYLLDKLEVSPRSSSDLSQSFIHLLRKESTRHFVFQLLEEDPTSFLHAAREASLSANAMASLEVPPLSIVLENAPLLPLPADILCEKIIILESRLHVKLVWQQANKFAGRYSIYSAADLVGWGWQGLRVALRKFDPSKGWAFSTYACTRIGGAIRDGVRSESPLPKRLTTYVHSVNAAKEQLTSELYRQPTQAELLARLGGPSKEFFMLPRLGTAASLDELILGSENVTIASSLTTNETPEGTCVQRELVKAAFRVIETLPPEDFRLIQELVLEKKTFKEVAASMDISVRTLKDRKERILSKIRATLSEWDLVEA